MISFHGLLVVQLYISEIQLSFLGNYDEVYLFLTQLYDLACAFVDSEFGLGLGFMAKFGVCFC